MYLLRRLKSVRSVSRRNPLHQKPSPPHPPFQMKHDGQFNLLALLQISDDIKYPYYSLDKTNGITMIQDGFRDRNIGLFCAEYIVIHKTRLIVQM